MTLSLGPDGLQTQTQQEIVDELAERLRNTFGANLTTDADSLMGQLVNILSELRALDQQTLLSVYRSFDPNGAIGRALDARLALTGSVRKGATRSVVDGELTFSGAGTMNNGDLIRNLDNDTLWELTDGPHTAAGAEVIPAQFTAVDSGPILANAGTTWSLVTVVAGLDSFANSTDDAAVGRNHEADGPARASRLREIYAQGQGPLAAIQGVVSQVNGVQYVRVYHNPSVSPTDSNGIPFKAFNVVVETNPSTPPSALQQSIFTAIWSAMGAGGQAYGTDYSGLVIDSEGFNQPIAFDTVTLVDIELEIDLVTSTSENAVSPNIEIVVFDRILETAQADHVAVGRDVLALDYQGIVQAMLTAGEISGVDAVNVRMGRDMATPGPAAKLSISIREKADFDSGNLTVVQV